MTLSMSELVLCHLLGKQLRYGILRIVERSRLSHPQHGTLTVRYKIDAQGKDNATVSQSRTHPALVHVRCLSFLQGRQPLQYTSKTLRALTADERSVAR